LSRACDRGGLFIQGVEVEFDAVIAVMIVVANFSRIVVRSSCLICGADDEIVDTEFEVEGCDRESEVECKDFEGEVEDEMIEGVESANTNFAAL
jgi:hypothetical protein